MKYIYRLIFDESKFWEYSCLEEHAIHLASWLIEYFSEDIQSIVFDHASRRVTVIARTTWEFYCLAIELLDNRYPGLIIDA